ncbi:hypothetical protein Lepto7375DRAFT_1066 [Leptolyngbya sp. PCC 7375]|nr:hypothetical protein Lepto7375DRAFT_1066 [Leptolyngbya sp. PCC 7375]
MENIFQKRDSLVSFWTIPFSRGYAENPTLNCDGPKNSSAAMLRAVYRVRCKTKSGTMSLTIRERSQKVAGYIKTETHLGIESIASALGISKKQCAPSSAGDRASQPVCRIGPVGNREWVSLAKTSGARCALPLWHKARYRSREPMRVF